MGSPQLRAFHPLVPNNTVVVSVTTGAQSTVLPPTKKFGTCAIRVVNSGTDTVFLEFGNADATVTASTTTSMPMLGNTVEVFTLTQSTYTIGYIGVAGGNTLYITPGEGL